jgi:hypothetical protein
MIKNLNALNIVSFLFGLLLLTIGIMNVFMVHPIPGIIYILVSLVFFPPTNNILKKTLNFTIPFKLKLIIFILIMWFTLGVGDLAEIYGL